MAWGWVNVQLIFIFWVNYSFKEVNYYWGSQLEQNAPDWQGLWGFNTFPDATKKTWPRNFYSLCGAVHPALASPEKQPSFSQSNFQYLHKYVWSQTLRMCVCVCVYEREKRWHVCVCHVFRPPVHRECSSGMERCSHGWQLYKCVYVCVKRVLAWKWRGIFTALQNYWSDTA